MRDLHAGAVQQTLPGQISGSPEALLTRPEGSGSSPAAASQPGQAPQHAPTSAGVATAVQPRWWTRKLLLGAVAAVVLVAGLGFAVAANSESPEEQPGKPRLLAVHTMELQTVTSYQAKRQFTGAIVARRASELGFELTGKLARIHVNDGAAVRAGEDLAELATEHLDARRRQFVAKRAQAAAKLQEMISGPRQEDIAAARARVESLRAQVELLRLQKSRHQRLVAQNATSQDEYEQYAFGWQARQSQLDEAQHDLDELLNGTRKEQIQSQRAAVDEMDAAIGNIDVELGKSTLQAPFAGTIARRWVDEGTVVAPGQTIFRLVEDQVLEAWIGLPVHVTRQLAENSPQRVTIDGQTFAATVAGRFPEVDPATRTRTIVLKLDATAAEKVVHGQVARLELAETVRATGSWLPSTALTAGTRGLWSAFVAVPKNEIGASGPSPAGWPGNREENNVYRVERREVEVLHTEGHRVLVRGTLRERDRVITKGIHRVVPGQFVRLTLTR